MINIIKEWAIRYPGGRGWQIPLKIHSKTGI
jgi:hypothetical protein